MKYKVRSFRFHGWFTYIVLFWAITIFGWAVQTVLDNPVWAKEIPAFVPLFGGLCATGITYVQIGVFRGKHPGSIYEQGENLKKCLTFLKTLCFEEVVDIISDEALETKALFEKVKKYQKVDDHDMPQEDLDRLREATMKADAQKKRFWQIRDALALVHEGIPETIEECANWASSQD